MGINIAGIVINKNIEENAVEELANILKLNLAFDKEIDFATASQNGKDEAHIDVYFSKKGTIVFTNTDSIAEENVFPRTKILTFAIAEADMTFNFNYSENNRSIRYVMELEGDIIDDDGEQLEIEEKSASTVETIWKQINQLLGESFWKIEPTEKAFRYIIKPAQQELPTTVLAASASEVQPVDAPSSTLDQQPTAELETPKKDWWAFWK